MKIKSLGRALVAVLCFAAQAAGASAASSWAMTEIYSNADGSVQFLEFYTVEDIAAFLTGDSMTSATPGGTNTYTFPSDLGPGFAQGKRMLVGTEGFAALGVVAPDFVVPNGFFSADGGTVIMGDYDRWDYPPLPVDGLLSLYRGGAIITNTPTNYAGATGTVKLAPTLNFQALWWAAPAGIESGWGVNITHQGDTLFATWFTYDLDGSAMWLVASDTRRTSGNTFAGPLYRTTGPVFSSAVFDPAKVALTQVGNVTFAFNDTGAGTFSYSVNGISQSKAITRQVYDAEVSSCTAGGTVDGTPNYQDLWWRAPAGSESGWGVNITHQGDILFATWFTYDASGKGMWIVMSDGQLTSPGTYSGALYRTTGAPFNSSPWDPARTVLTQVGAGSFAFSGLNAGTFSYTLNGISQAKAITRQVYAAPTTACRRSARPIS
jgi:hypothetical protein